MVNVTQMTHYHKWRTTIKNNKTIDFKSGVSFSEHNMYVTVWVNDIPIIRSIPNVLVQDFASDQSLYHEPASTMWLLHATYETWYKVFYQNIMHAISLSIIYRFEKLLRAYVVLL